MTARTLERRGRAWCLMVLAALTIPHGVGAQDIETLARLRGLPLPAAYFERVQQDPTAFEFSRALFNRSEIGLTAAHGDVRLPVVLALFSDSPEPHITREMAQASLFDGPAEMGTVTESYLEMSRGALQVQGDVFPWARTSLTMSVVVGTGNGLGSDALVGPYFTEALDSIDADVDFALYDNDGPDGVANSGDDDGYVDVITFEYLEVAASCGGPAIWPHRWTMEGQTGAPYDTDDFGIDGGTIRIQDYITQSVADCGGLAVQNAGVIAHEFGHALGLPDFYHPVVNGIGAEGRRWVMGCWALMAGGSWGCGRIDEQRAPFGPTHMQAYSKHFLGWIEYLDIGEVWNEEIVLDPVQTSGIALRVPMGSQGTEFLIAEYRAQIGFDAQLPADGVLLYKQDLTAARRPDPNTNDPYFLTLLEQDGNRGLQRHHLDGGDRGVAGDAWGVSGLSSKLNAETTPVLRLSGGGRTPVMVHEVRVGAGVARIVISTGTTPRLIPPSEPLEVTRVRTFLESVRIAGGTGPYTATGTVPTGISLDTGGDELFVVGSVTEEGPYDLVLSVRDALGHISDEITVALSAPIEWTVEVVNLLQRFLQTDVDPLTPGELTYLDDIGNQNGTYDVGDLRKWLREQGPPAR